MTKIVAPVKKKRLTKKQKGFVAEYAKTGNGSAAVKSSYDVASDNVARTMASELLDKPHIAAALGEAIPDELLKEKHLALLNKMETRQETDPNTNKTIIVRTKEINAAAVAKGLELAYKVKGAFIEPVESSNKVGNTYNFFYKPEIKAATERYEEEVKKLLYGDKSE